MKGIKSKSKSKSKQKRPYQPPPASHQTPQKSRKKPTKGGQKRRQFLIRFLNGKVVFNMSKADQFMFSPFTYLFHDRFFNLCDSSGIMRLKAMPVTARQLTYYHNLDTKQAIFLYYKLYRARLGDVDVVKQLRELVEVISRQAIQQRQGSNNKEQFNKQVDVLRRKVKEICNRQNEKQEKGFIGSIQEVKLNLLDERIRELGIRLLDMTIVAIRQKDEEDQVDVIFQQSYVDKTCKKDFLLNIIGEEMFISKKVNFVRLYGYARRNYKANTNFIVCHMCKQLIVDEYLRCQNKQYESIIPNYKNSPNVYFQHLMSLNYCHHPHTELDQNSLLQELDYFKYFPFNQFKCNRFICKKCTQAYILFQKPSQRVQFTCSFCFGDCLCKSCTVASQLVKALALYRDIIQRNKQDINRYYQLIKFVNLDDENQVWLDPPMRNTFRYLERKEYQYYYENLLDKYMKINKVMDNFQKIAMRNYDLFEEMKHMVTHNMAQARKFCLELISERNAQKQSRGGKSLNTVRSSCKEYEQRLKKKKQDDKQEQRYNLRYLQLKLRNLNPSLKIKSLKDKLKQYNIMNGESRKYMVPFQPYDLTDVQNLLNEMQVQQYTNKTQPKKYPTVNNDKIRKVMFMKKEVPFQEIDYQLAQNVKKQCIILDKKQLRLQQAVRKKILYEVDHYDYGIKGIAFYRYPQKPQQLIQIINNSQQSQQQNDSEKIVEEGVSQPQQYSVSCSSFLNRAENQNIFTPKQSQNYSSYFSVNSEQYVDAGSEQIILNETNFGTRPFPQMQQQQAFDKILDGQKPQDKSQPLISQKNDQILNPIPHEASKEKKNQQNLEFSSSSSSSSSQSSSSNRIKHEGGTQNKKGNESEDSDELMVISQQQWNKGKTK